MGGGWSFLITQAHLSMVTVTDRSADASQLAVCSDSPSLNRFTELDLSTSAYGAF